VENKQHITDHTEHKNFNTNHNEEHGKNSERNVIDALQPFMQNINPGEYAKCGNKETHHPKIEHGIVYSRQPVNGAYDLDTIMKR
jgi:hypothetical protein